MNTCIYYIYDHKNQCSIYVYIRICIYILISHLKRHQPKAHKHKNKCSIYVYILLYITSIHTQTNVTQTHK